MGSNYVEANFLCVCPNSTVGGLSVSVGQTGELSPDRLPDQVTIGIETLHYLARYTHRVAISNHRLVNVTDGKVTFRWKDYAHGSKQS